MSHSKPVVRIESDGSPQGTKITVDGVLLCTVTNIRWECDFDSPLATAHLTLVDVEVDVVGDGTMAVWHKDQPQDEHDPT